MAMLDELRLVVYEPVCDATEFRRRLGGPPDVLGLEDLARRLRRRAASADTGRLRAEGGSVVRGGRGVRGRRHVYSVDDFHRELAVLFGRDRDTILQTRRPLATAPSSSLPKGAGGRRSKRLMEADQFIELFDKAHIGCQARHVRAAVARAGRRVYRNAGRLGRARLGLASMLCWELCRGGPLNARRSKLVRGPSTC